MSKIGISSLVDFDAKPKDREVWGVWGVWEEGVVIPIVEFQFDNGVLVPSGVLIR